MGLPLAQVELQTACSKIQPKEPSTMAMAGMKRSVCCSSSSALATSKQNSLESESARR